MGLSLIGVEIAAIRNEDLGWIIEEPSEEVSRNIEEGGDDTNKGEVGEAGTEVATGEKDEAGEGEAGAEGFWRGDVPVKAGDDVHGEGDGVESGDEEDERCERKNEVKDNKAGGKAGESTDAGTKRARSQAEKMDDLGGEKEDEADFGGVIEGENNVGNTGREHGGE